MKRKTFLSGSVFVIGVSCWAARPSAAEVSGATSQLRPFRVRIFAGYDLRSITIAGSALRVRVAHAQYSGQMLSVNAGSNSAMLDEQSLPFDQDFSVIGADGSLTISAATLNGNPIVRRYAGELQILSSHGALSVINTVPVESYVASTLASEASPSWSSEALRAQAIAVRSFAVHAASAKSARSFDLTDDTSSQVYRGADSVTPVFSHAASSTQNQIVTWQGETAAVFYSATCGGHTASLTELNGEKSLAYLGGVADAEPGGRPYCAPAPYFRWRNSLSADSLARALDVSPGTLADCSVSERWPDGRVRTLRVVQNGAPELTISGRTFYTRSLQSLGYKVVPSTMFDIQRDGAEFIISGHGIGHGVGLCQWGARGRADAGHKAAEILQAYFPGTAVTALTAH